MMKGDLRAALAAGGIDWNEGHYVLRAPECRCAMCRGIRIASEAAAREMNYQRPRAEATS